jgi:hypothetical protein
VGEQLTQPGRATVATRNSASGSGRKISESGAGGNHGARVNKPGRFRHAQDSGQASRFVAFAPALRLAALALRQHAHFPLQPLQQHADARDATAADSHPVPDSVNASHNAIPILIQAGRRTRIQEFHIEITSSAGTESIVEAPYGPETAGARPGRSAGIRAAGTTPRR